MLSDSLKQQIKHEAFFREVRNEGIKPVTREGASLTIVNKKVVMFGGFSQEVLSDTFLIDPTKLKWVVPEA